jgi:predicted RNA polymerase sigma factor
LRTVAANTGDVGLAEELVAEGFIRALAKWAGTIDEKIATREALTQYLA